MKTRMGCLAVIASVMGIVVGAAEVRESHAGSIESDPIDFVEELEKAGGK